MSEIAELVGLTLTKVEKIEYVATSWHDTGDQICFHVDDGRTYKMYHDQDCCEHVYVESIVGDLSDLMGSPILQAEEVASVGGDGREYRLVLRRNHGDVYVGVDQLPSDVVPDWATVPKTGPDGNEYTAESYTWTFYKIGTIKGNVTIRWYGSSNGYYSEGVNFELVRQS